MGEFYYALSKARAYAAMMKDQSSRQSYRDFERLLEADDAYVRAADEYRLSGAHDPGRLAAVLERHDEVKRLAAQVADKLSNEAR